MYLLGDRGSVYLLGDSGSVIFFAFFWSCCV